MWIGFGTLCLANARRVRSTSIGLSSTKRIGRSRFVNSQSPTSYLWSVPRTSFSQGNGRFDPLCVNLSVLCKTIAQYLFRKPNLSFGKIIQSNHASDHRISNLLGVESIILYLLTTCFRCQGNLYWIYNKLTGFETSRGQESILEKWVNSYPKKYSNIC